MATLRQIIKKFETVPVDERVKVLVDFDTIYPTNRYKDYCGDTWRKQDRLKAWYLSHWYCTDTWVGMILYYFDGEPVLLTRQTSRKSETNEFWLDISKYQEIYIWMNSFLKEDDFTNPDAVDLDEESGLDLDGYDIDFTGELTHSHKMALYNGKPVTLNSEKNIDIHKKEYLAKSASVTFPESDEEKTVELSSLTFPWGK